MNKHNETWEPGTSNPYGLPAPAGNYDQIWQKFMQVPCTTCGATEKHLTIDSNKKITITCGPFEQPRNSMSLAFHTHQNTHKRPSDYLACPWCISLMRLGGHV